MGGITAPPALVGVKLRELYSSLINPNIALSNQSKAATEAVEEQYLSCMLLVGANNAKLG